MVKVEKMGLSELVLKVPATEITSSRPPTANTGQAPSSHESASTSSSIIKNKSKTKKSSCQKTHSRESSGASNLSVRFTVTDETASKAQEAKARIQHQRSSDEDITLSDRLSQDLDDEDELEDDGFHHGSSKSCESIPHDRLTPYAHDGGLRMLPSDSKSQNSDYGSFCQTPSDTFGNGESRVGSGNGGSGSGAMSPGPDDNAGPTSGSGDTQRQPLLPPNLADDEESSCDEGASTSNADRGGFMRRRNKYRRPREDTDGSMSDTESMANGQNIKGEPIKTLLAGIFLIFAWVATTTSLALTHERVPEIDSLPDFTLDNIKTQSWGLDASEIVIMICTLMAFLVSIFHKHRFIVLRRIFLLVGIHYYYRAVTMYLTVLPKPNEHYTCAPKTGNETTALVIFQRVLKLLSGMGLSINGKHIYCGDYIYSGHTMTLLMTYLVIKEYSPKKWYLLHYLSMALTIFGIVALLLGRGHYSIDVLIAYWITTRLWWIYHTIAKHDMLRASENEDNHLNKVWWWYIFTYFEGRVPTQLPREYGWPLPQRLLQWNVFRRLRSPSEATAQDDDQEDLEAGLGPQ